MRPYDLPLGDPRSAVVDGVAVSTAAVLFVAYSVATGLTVYDAQRLKVMAFQTPAGQESSYAVVGALTLYLDFVNLFLFLLRFTGNRRDY